jgi:hypothetical protein
LWEGQIIKPAGPVVRRKGEEEEAAGGCSSCLKTAAVCMNII